MSKTKILIIHPVGNILNNPNLLQIFLALNEEYETHVLLPKLKILQHHKTVNGKLIIYPKCINILANIFQVGIVLKIIAGYLRLFYLKEKYDLIIGVDRLGLIWANCFSKGFKSPYALISYEIFFRRETSKLFKLPEIKASKGISFAVVQDDKRAEKLSEENKIDKEKLIQIPVASSFSKPYKKNMRLYHELGIPSDKKILLFIGSVAKWTCIDKILSQLSRFPDSWVLVLHDRYGKTKSKVDSMLVELNLDPMSISGRLYYSNLKLPTTEDMHHLLHSADLGLCAYCPTYSDIYTGDNLKYIGLASGKATTYLQHGLPVVALAGGQIGEIVKNNRLGFTLEKIEELSDCLAKYDSSEAQSMHKNCYDYFNREISFNLFKEKFLNKVREAIHVAA